MNLLSELKVKIKDQEVTLKLNNLALYRAQQELEKNGLMELISSIDSMDLKTVYVILKHCCPLDISEEELMESEINLIEAVQFISNNLAVLFTGKKTKPSRAKKKK